MEMFQRYTRASTTNNTTSDGKEDVEIGTTSSSGFGHRRRNISDTEPLLGPNTSSNTTNIGSSPSSMNFKDTTSSTIPLSSSLSMSNHGISKDSNGVSSSSSSVGGTNSNTTTPNNNNSTGSSGGISNMGYFVLILLAVQNCSKNLLMRYVMKDSPKFFTSTAVLCCECMKFTMSVIYIVSIQKKSFRSILTYMEQDMTNTLLLAVPATAYNFQMKLEYVALANLNAAIFSVLVQTKLLCTAIMAYAVLRKKLKYIQIISLTLLTVGVMLCNLSGSSSSGSSSSSMMMDSATLTGVMATLGIAMSSGFASVYTEKVIKANRSITAPMMTTPSIPSTTTTIITTTTATTTFDRSEYGLAYTQVQLAFMSICTIGLYALWQDLDKILEFGLFYQFSYSAMFSVLNSAIGGLIVASVLKYADSVLKGYATAMSVILTGIFSMLLFNTSLSIIYFLGIVNVVTAVLLYNGKDLDQMMC